VTTNEKGIHMGLFDTIREKAAELLSGVTEKAGDLAGDLPGAEALQDLTESASDAAGQATDEATGAVQDVGDRATDAADAATESITEIPGESPPQP
jgi:phage-related minor tail protein